MTEIFLKKSILTSLEQKQKNIHDRKLITQTEKILKIDVTEKAKFVIIFS